MDAMRRKRLEELRGMFTVTVIDGQTPPHDAVAETVALYLNSRNGKQVVVPRDSSRLSRSMSSS